MKKQKKWEEEGKKLFGLSGLEILSEGKNQLGRQRVVFFTFRTDFENDEAEEKNTFGTSVGCWTGVVCLKTTLRQLHPFS